MKAEDEKGMVSKSDDDIDGDVGQDNCTANEVLTANIIEACRSKFHSY